MRLIIANPFYPPYAPGGAEHSLEQMCKRFATEGWEIRVVSNCYNGKPGIEPRDGYEVQFVESPVRLSEGQQIDATSYLKSPGYEETLTRSLVKTLEASDEQQILIANNAQCLVSVSRAGAKTRVPTVGIVRDTQVICEAGSCIDNQPAVSATPCQGLLGSAFCMLRFQRQRGVTGWRTIPSILLSGMRNGLRRILLRRCLTEMTSVVTISDALRDLLYAIPDIKRRDVVTIRNFHTAVNPVEEKTVREFLLNLGLEPNKYFLVVGRKTYGKGADLAVKAIQAVNAAIPDARLLLLGREKVASPPSGAFIDHPPISQSLLLGVLKASRGLLIPGRWQEGLHRTMIDALFLGVPVICSEAGAPPVEGVVDGLNGYVVRCNDERSLAEAMLKMMDWREDDFTRSRLASAERFRQRFADEVILEQWRNFFKSLLKQSLQ